MCKVKIKLDTNPWPGPASFCTYCPYKLIFVNNRFLSTNHKVFIQKGHLLFIKKNAKLYNTKGNEKYLLENVGEQEAAKLLLRCINLEKNIKYNHEKEDLLRMKSIDIKSSSV